jgi:5S rRNA maturation endonuclease (ribonuclease M5)
MEAHMSWVRVSSNKPCPVCGKTDWCSISEDGSACICPRTEKGSKKYIDGSGYLHILKETEDWRIELARPEQKQLPEHNEVLAIIARKMCKAITEEKLVDLAENLDISLASLKRLHLGYSFQQGAYSFPMQRHKNRLIGIRMRNMDGKKWAVKGSRQGLFIPSGLTGRGGIVICEGPTDTGCLLDMEFDAIGRPSCNSGTDLIKEVVSDRHVAIMADCDGPGLDGAERLATSLRDCCRSVTVAIPPAKDAREFVQQGATRRDFLELIKGK